MTNNRKDNMKNNKCTGWAYSLMEREDGTWYRETITELMMNGFN